MAAKTRQRRSFFVEAEVVVARPLPRVNTGVAIAGELQTNTLSPYECGWAACAAMWSLEDANRERSWLRQGKEGERASWL